MNLLIPLIILFCISATGIILYFFKRINQTILNLLIALGAGSMLAVSLVHILTEALGSSELAIYAFMSGFLIIYLVEELLTKHHHDHKHGDHTHEDPHEHYNHVALVTGIAIFVHTLFDGLGIRAGFGISNTLGYSILFGVAIHQIPVSLSLAAILQESGFRRRTQIGSLILFALAAPIGFYLSDVLLSHTSEIFTALTTAFAGGSLLYVSAADLLPVVHSQSRYKYLTIACFVIGVVGMSAVKLLE
ncbi:MAG: ZIP family metal transporter [Candidatus Gracilibacteria bacterium]|nr:ZIP family metal transporter [Candidatus Gracilibacteria bacterium]